ncbi:unnamed protein product [Xylocopa violacea]|uniref:Uncharacterized protein n=1 Tax=Xylocopa violacea TaxID=135666 RepID=A0ABP1NUJ4_XYLVO
MMENMEGCSKPKMWCAKEDYKPRDGDGISMSTTSGSSNCGSREIEAVVYRGTRVKQQGELFILEPSSMIVVESKHPR